MCYFACRWLVAAAAKINSYLEDGGWSVLSALFYLSVYCQCPLFISVINVFFSTCEKCQLNSYIHCKAETEREIYEILKFISKLQMD